MTTIVESVELTVFNCGECAGTYAINERYRRQKQENTGGWHCPYCESSWGYFGKTQAQKLEEKLKAAEESRRSAWRETEKTSERLDAERRSHTATKGHLTRKKKRAANGTCPCCNRTFKQLAAHMKNKHPEYGDDA